MFQPKRSIVAALAALATLLLATPLPAQEPGEEEMAAMMAAGQPGEHHKHLSALEGSWDVAARFWMPGAAEPMTSAGKADFTWTLGGRFLRQDYTGEFMGAPFQGVGITGYDNMTGQYQSLWMDSITTAILSETGTCDGGGKTIEWHGEMPDPVSGTMMKSRTEQVVESPDRVVLTGYITGADGKESRHMELVYTRRK